MSKRVDCPLCNRNASFLIYDKNDEFIGCSVCLDFDDGAEILSGELFKKDFEVCQVGPFIKPRRKEVVKNGKS